MTLLDLAQEANNILFVVFTVDEDHLCLKWAFLNTDGGGRPPRVSDSVGLESPQMMLALLVWGPHGELGSKLLGAEALFFFSSHPPVPCQQCNCSVSIG